LHIIREVLEGTMMRIMRENPVFVLGVIIFVVGAFIGTIFLVYGMRSGGGGGGPTEETAIAVVEGREVSYSEYLNVYNTQVEFYRQFYPEIGITEMEERFQLRQKALDALINSRLLHAEAERMGLVVGDEELRKKIEENPLFQENGRFSASLYRSILTGSRVTPAAYEESQRAEMLSLKVRNLVSDAARVTEAEAWESFRQDKEKVKLLLLPLEIDTYRSWVATTEEEVEERFEQERERYRRPDRLRASYVAVASTAFEAKVEIAEEAVRDFYEFNQKDYETPPQVRARHILIKVPEGTSAEREEELRERAGFVQEKASEGSDFAALAKEFSQDSTGPGGGDLGWFSRGQMVTAFEEAAFALDAGEISDVVRSEYGFHVIKVEETKGREAKPFEEVREAVEDAYRRQEARRLTAEEAERIYDFLLDEEFGKVADEFGLEVKKVERLTREDLLPGLGYRPEVSKELFDLEEGEVSDILRQENDYYIFHVEKKTPSYLPDLAEVREEVRGDVIDLKAREEALKEAERILGKLRGGGTLSSVAAGMKREIEETALFGRSGFVLEAGDQGEKFDEAFQGEEGSYGGPVYAGGKVWLFQVKELVPASAEAFEKEKGEIVERMLEEKRESLFQSWIEDLRSIRTVTVDESLLGT
jgi:peptidyl-prolyl cis-trans isomerase D